MVTRPDRPELRSLLIATVLSVVVIASPVAGTASVHPGTTGACSVLPVEQSVTPKTAQPGEDIEITTTIENTCDDEDWTDVVLMKDGQHVKQRRVTVPAHSTEMTTFTTSFSDPGEHELAIFDLDPVAVTIEAANQAPVIDDLQVPQAGQVGEEIQLDVQASDPDGAAADLSYDWSISGDGWEFPDGSSAADRAPTVTFESPGEYDVTATVTDPNGSSTASSDTIQIDPHNQAPVINDFQAPDSVQVGEEGAVSVEAEDPDGDPLAYDWTVDLGREDRATVNVTGFNISEISFNLSRADVPNESLVEMTINETGAAGPSPTVPIDSVINVTVNVSDSKGASAADVTTINITEAPKNAEEAIADADNEPGTSFTDILSAIQAFNEGTEVNGFEVTFNDILRAISNFNSGE